MNTKTTNFIQTVRGRISPDELGKTLMHEHVLVDFVGAKHISYDRWQKDQVERKMQPYLEKVRNQGFNAFVECTPLYIGRDPLLLKRLSEKTGLHILTNTGLYAAGQREGSPEPYLPPYAYELSARELAGGWLKEWYEGIEGTGVFPGFVKIGVNPGALRPISEKIVRAAAITSARSGLAVACHTGRGLSALRILKIFSEEKAAPDRYIFVHAQKEKEMKLHEECAREGAWIEFDGIRPKSAEQHFKMVLYMLERGYESQLLISQDAGWYKPGEPDGGEVRGYDYLWDEFVPRLIKEGVPQATIEHLLVYNPAEALRIR